MKYGLAGLLLFAAVLALGQITQPSGSVAPASTNYDSRLQPFLDKAATAQFQHVDVLILGDSLSRCWQGTTGTNGNCPGTGPINKDTLWTDTFRRYLQKRWGNGGTGMIPLQSRVDGTGFIDTVTYTLTGTYVRNSFLGPSTAGNGSNGSIYQFTPGSTITIAPQYGTSVRLYGATGGDNLGWSVAIDGTSVGTTYMTASGGNGTQAYFEAAAPTGYGLHTTVLTAVAGSGHSYAYAAEWRNPTGISVHNVAEGTCSATCYSTTPGLQLAFADLISPALTLIEFGVNEAYAAVATATFSANEQILITHYLGLGSQVALVNSPFVQGANIAPYMAVNAALATTNSIPDYDSSGAVFVSYANQVAQGWENADTIHLNNTGHIKWGEWFIPTLFGQGQGIVSF